MTHEKKSLRPQTRRELESCSTYSAATWAAAVVERRDQQNRTYFVNLITGKTAWTREEAEKSGVLSQEERLELAQLKLGDMRGVGAVFERVAGLFNDALELRYKELEEEGKDKQKDLRHRSLDLVDEAMRRLEAVDNDGTRGLKTHLVAVVEGFLARWEDGGSEGVRHNYVSNDFFTRSHTAKATSRGIRTGDVYELNRRLKLIDRAGDGGSNISLSDAEWEAAAAWTGDGGGGGGAKRRRKNSTRKRRRRTARKKTRQRKPKRTLSKRKKSRGTRRRNR